jgi:arsenite-transporting ATPase
LRLLLLTGDGGAGRTTVAAATALHAARCGVKTLLVALAPAGDGPLAAVREAAGPGLQVLDVDPRARAVDAWPAARGAVLGALDTLGLDVPAVAGLPLPPGAREVLTLLELRDAVLGGAHDLVVVDALPLAETLRLVELPDVLARWLERLLTVDRRLARALAAADAPDPAGAGRADALVEGLDRLRAELRPLARVLGAETTSVRPVLAPRPGLATRAQRALAALSVRGVRSDGVVVPGLVPLGDDPWRATRGRAQRAEVELLRAALPALPVVAVDDTADGAFPDGPDVRALGELARALHGPAGPGGAEDLLRTPAVPPPVRVERHDEDFVLVADLPGATRDTVALARRGDEIVLTVAAEDHVLPLPSALRRCTVAGATLRDGRLQVTFRPDPALWRSS